MPDISTHASPYHSHVFLGPAHEHAERRTWLVIWLCGAMMILEIGGGAIFGSIALIADGLHMSTHAGALLLAALAYSYARRHASDARFTFGTGKLGDLAGFSSAIVLAMIALLIGYEAISRLFAPVPIDYSEAIAIAVLGLAVNAASAWLLAGGHHHHHGHDHSAHTHASQAHRIATPAGILLLSIFEEDHPPVFRLRTDPAALPSAPNLTIESGLTIETVREGGARQTFALANKGAYLQSTETIPEPHAFIAHLRTPTGEHTIPFREHAHPAHDAAHRDNNMRAAVVHVLADAAVSVLVIVGLLLARGFGWLWMDPLAGMIGAGVIASWSYGLICDTGAILLDMVPDALLADGVRRSVEASGDTLTDLHVWRLGPGHLGAIVCVSTPTDRDPAFYRKRLRDFRTLSHVTVEIQRI